MRGTGSGTTSPHYSIFFVLEQSADSDTDDGLTQTLNVLASVKMVRISVGPPSNWYFYWLGKCTNYRQTISYLFKILKRCRILIYYITD